MFGVYDLTKRCKELLNYGNIIQSNSCEVDGGILTTRVIRLDGGIYVMVMYRGEYISATKVK